MRTRIVVTEDELSAILMAVARYALELETREPEDHEPTRQQLDEVVDRLASCVEAAARADGRGPIESIG